jgi:hypothetical protein
MKTQEQIFAEDMQMLANNSARIRKTSPGSTANVKVQHAQTRNGVEPTINLGFERALKAKAHKVQEQAFAPYDPEKEALKSSLDVRRPKNFGYFDGLPLPMEERRHPENEARARYIEEQAAKERAQAGQP